MPITAAGVSAPGPVCAQRRTELPAVAIAAATRTPGAATTGDSAAVPVAAAAATVAASSAATTAASAAVRSFGAVYRKSH